MNERHRQQQFPSPFEIAPDLELDLDRLLWVPGRKKIFIPAAPKPVYEGIDWAPNISMLKIAEDLDFQRECYRRLTLGGWETRFCDCVPARSAMIVPLKATEASESERQQQVRTWNDIRRSEVPMFRRRPSYMGY